MTVVYSEIKNKPLYVLLIYQKERKKTLSIHDCAMFKSKNMLLCIYDNVRIRNRCLYVAVIKKEEKTKTKQKTDENKFWCIYI